MNLLSILFPLFGKHAKETDTYKISDEGIWERYNKSMAQDYDENVKDLVDSYQDFIQVPATILAKLIPTMETMLGKPVIVLNDVSMRRKILRFVHTINNIRGTLLSYQVLIRMLGFDTVDIEVIYGSTGFDSDLTLDDPLRRFDSASNLCSDYNIVLTGSITITQDILDGLARIIDYLQPFNTHLKSVTYNGSPII